MIVTIHGISTVHCNLITSIRIASQTGYDAMEIYTPKLMRYLDAGYSVDDLKEALDAQSMPVVCLNGVKDIERVDEEGREAMLAEIRRQCAIAEALKCPTIQIMPFCSLQGREWKEIRTLTAKNIAAIADIGKEHGVRFQIEPIAWSPVCSLGQSLELIDEAGRDNVAMVIDFWHLVMGGRTTPDEVARLDKSMIYGVHFGDAIMPEKGAQWVEEDLRCVLPGDGQMPLAEWIAAVKATGFDGVWSTELISPRHWEWDLWDIARECKKRMLKYTA